MLSASTFFADSALVSSSLHGLDLVSASSMCSSTEAESPGTWVWLARGDADCGGGLSNDGGSGRSAAAAAAAAADSSAAWCCCISAVDGEGGELAAAAAAAAAAAGIIPGLDSDGGSTGGRGQLDGGGTGIGVPFGPKSLKMLLILQPLLRFIPFRNGLTTFCLPQTLALARTPPDLSSTVEPSIPGHWYISSSIWCGGSGTRS